MRGKIVGLVVILFAVMGGIGFYVMSQNKTSPSNSDFTPKLLSRLGGMDCYTFNETVIVTYSNITITSTLTGGFYNGTYFFHGKKNGTEWWTVISGGELIQRVLINGSSKIIEFNITQDQRSLMTIYDPVKLALRAVGAGKEISRKRNSGEYHYTIRLTEKELMCGNLTVWVDKNFYPVKIVSNGVTFREGNRTVVLSIRANVFNKCVIPSWVKELKS